MSDVRDWRTQGPLQRLQQRAFLCAQIRSFFASRGVTEVVTPVLSSAANTDLQIEVFSSQSLTLGNPILPSFSLAGSPVLQVTVVCEFL